MSTGFFKNRSQNEAAGPGQELRCWLCRGELYPGDPYFALDGRVVCEDCLERYARRRFAHRLRRVGRDEEEDGRGTL